MLLRRGIARGKMRVTYEERVLALDEEGRFAARDLVPGRYQVELRFGSNAPPLVEPERAEVEIEVGVKSAPVELAFARPIRLSGKLEPTGLDPRSATVEFARAGVEGWTTLPLRPDGGFEIGGLWPAKWRLRVRTQAGIGPEIEAGPKAESGLRLVRKS